ncbi:DMT family transporter [Planococcus lenghuensis]|uniref:QacE family quaternary ammonium compound efflux SMR transporter n=1 Tax=Planococcus lenghuensis TaxID=2213202 RepID=A0A1Q2KVG7_9BACL|nr:multidrug efflux SMR transporter [Planococcus lenghuensis]AQQ52133.1 QacE family quaternary ammonium compound efflux SMR transporter [Planococcus lenghuensis]
MAWIILIVAGLFEVAFVVTMKLSDGFTSLRYSILTVLTGGASFYLLSLALISLPVGTGYAVWTGIGAAGSVLAGMLWFGESRSAKKLFFLTCIVTGVAGLRVFSG